MGLLSHRVELSEIKPGDHIYTWRAGYTYSHHGTRVSSSSASYIAGGLLAMQAPPLSGTPGRQVAIVSQFPSVGAHHPRRPGWGG